MQRILRTETKSLELHVEFMYFEQSLEDVTAFNDRARYWIASDELILSIKGVQANGIPVDADYRLLTRNTDAEALDVQLLFNRLVKDT